MTGPGIDIDVGRCLMKAKHYAEAEVAFRRAYYTENIDPRAVKFVMLQAPLGAAQAYWAMGKHDAAVKWIAIAWDKSDGSDEVLSYYEQYTGKLPPEITPEVKNARAYWDSLSEDQRKVIYDKGGERDDNSGARPCHVEKYDATNFHQVTWWYCNDDEQHSYQKAYTFINGRLHSSYTP
jgi:tetratricopeptide (TPR) repeat protein